MACLNLYPTYMVRDGWKKDQYSINRRDGVIDMRPLEDVVRSMRGRASLGDALIKRPHHCNLIRSASGR
jgi:hypothetical protein